MKDRVCLRKRSAPRGPHVIAYSATLDVPAETATLLTELLVAERLRRGTGVGTRAACRVTGFLGALYAAAALLGLPALADKGYDGAGAGVLTPTKGGNLHPDNLTRNQLVGCLRAQGERAIALLKTRWKALNRIRLCPQRIGAIAKPALVRATR